MVQLGKKMRTGTQAPDGCDETAADRGGRTALRPEWVARSPASVPMADHGVQSLCHLGNDLKQLSLAKPFKMPRVRL